VLQLCYTLNMASSTTSFRISDDLRLRLEETARYTGKTKNSIVSEALEEYLKSTNYAAIAAEARRQSLAASAASAPEDEAWLDAMAADAWSEE
jgi:predicted DNA-binding protein